MLPYGAEGTKSQNSDSQITGLSFGQAIRIRQLWMLLAASCCFGFCLHLVIVHIVPHATDLGISAAKATSIMATIGGVGIIARILMGSAGDQIGVKQTFALSFLLLSVAMALLVPAKELWMFYLFAAIFSVSYAGVMALLAPLVADLFGLRSHGTVMGSTALLFNIGGAVGSALAGHIFDVNGSYQSAFIIGMALSIVGSILVLLLRPTGKGIGYES